MSDIDVFDLFAKISLDTSEYESGLNNAKGKFESFSDNLKNAGESITKVGSTLTKSVTLPVAGLGTAILKTGMDYEAGMSKVQAISGATGNEMDMLGQKAMEMAAKTKFSTSDSAEAYQYMAMAGWKASDMVDGLAGIMNLAAASGENLGTTSDIVTDALTAFGLKAANSGRFADVLAAASNNANTNVSMLGESFKYVAPVAGALGYSVEDTSVALGLMANSGIKASSAGTALRTTLTNMSKPTADMEKAMYLLGVSLQDDNGEMYSLMEVMEQLRAGFRGGTIDLEAYNFHAEQYSKFLASGVMDAKDYSLAMQALEIALNGTTEAQAAELAAMLAGKEGMSGLLAIVNSTEEDFNKLTDAINNSNGTAEEMARIMQDNAAGAFERLKSAVNVLFTQLSEQLIPGFTAVVEKATAVINWFGQLDGGTQKLILTIAGVAAVVGPVLVVTGKIITAIATISSGISGLIGVVKGVAGAVSGLFSILAANPIGLVIAAVAALTAGLLVLWNTNEGFRNAVKAIWDAIVGFFQAAVDAIIAAWGGVKEFFAGIWDGIQSVFSGVAEFFGGLFQAAAEIVQSVWSAVVDFFSGVWDGIQGVFSTVADVLGGFFSAAWEIIQSVWGAAIDFFNGIVDGIRSVFEGVSQFLGEAFSSAWNAVKGAWDAAVGFFSDIWNNVREKGGEAADKVGEAFGKAWEGIKTAWNGALSFFGGIWSEVKGVFGDAWNAFTDIGGKIVDGIKSGISNAWKSLTGWVNGLFGDLVKSVKSTLGIHSPSTVFAGIGGNMALGLGEGWNSEYSAIQAKITNGLNFGTATVGLSANVSGHGGAYGQSNALQGNGVGNTFNFTFNSPKALDPVSAAKESKKAAQQIALQYV